MSVLKNNKDAKIVEIFHIRTNELVKFAKYKVPIIFSVSLKKNAQLVYCKYDDLKAQNPMVILEYFEERAQFRYQEDQNPRPFKQLPSPKKQEESQEKRYGKYSTTGKSSNRKQSRQSRQLRQLRQSRDNRYSKSPIKQKDEIKQIKYQHPNNEDNYIQYPAPIQKKEVKEEQIYDINKFNKYITQNQSRPIRSCRMRNDYMKVNDGYEYQGQYKGSKDNLRNINNNIQTKYEEQSEEQESQEENQFQQKNLLPICQYVQMLNKRQSIILDYDTYLEQKGNITLISPAVIPSIKSATQRQYIPPPVPLNIIKEIQREPFSSEQFHDLDESQFILDERGKQRRRRQKMLKDQERQPIKKKRIKKLKPKKKTYY